MSEKIHLLAVFCRCSSDEIRKHIDSGPLGLTRDCMPFVTNGQAHSAWAERFCREACSRISVACCAEKFGALGVSRFGTLDERARALVGWLSTYKLAELQGAVAVSLNMLFFVSSK